MKRRGGKNICYWNKNVVQLLINICRFPQDPELRRQWVKAVNRKGFTPTECSKLCSAHFHENDFEVGGLRRQLNKDAVPTKFDFPSFFKPTITKNRRVLKKVEVRDFNNCKDRSPSVSALFQSVQYST